MLSDFRVLDLSDERGMLAGLILADLGADVIAVEPPGGSSARRLGPFFQDSGDGEDSLFWWSYGRNKRGIVLDLDDPSGPDELLALAASADVVIESFEPGFLDARGIGYAGLSAINPGISLVSITPFGQSGPKALWASNALTGLAASCVLDLTGDEDRAPLQVPGAQAYLHAGAEAAVGALIALRARGARRPRATCRRFDAGRDRDGDPVVHPEPRLGSERTDRSLVWGRSLGGDPRALHLPRQRWPRLGHVPFRGDDRPLHRTAV